MAYTNIDDPSAYFQTKIYTGDGQNNRAITYDGNSDMQPDFLWFKLRSTTGNHVLLDSSRGSSKYLRSNNTAAESTSDTLLKSFDSDGFTVGDSASTNYNTYTLVSWGWKANGGTTVSNTDGDIDSTVQVNQDAGFSIVQYVPTNTTARSIGHGLGVQPQVVIVRNRNRIENWRVFHRSAGTTGGLKLDDDTAYNSTTTLFTGDSTSTVFKVGTDFSVNGNYPYVAYCFAEKQGYSKFGKYVGNGNADGAFVYTGFKPAFVLYKKTTVENWIILDNKRDPHNVAFTRLVPNKTNADTTSLTSLMDFTSNGFKLRTSHTSINSNNTDYIYMAFAENPFVTSTGIPTTAR